MPVRDLIRNRATQQGDRVAVQTVDGAAFTYGAAHQLALAAGEFATRCGMGPGDRVAVALPNSLDYIVWLFALLQGGATAVPVDPRLPAAEGDALLQDAGCRFRVLSADAAPASAAWRTVGESGTCRIERRDEARVFPAGSHGYPVLVQFSSGSSGRPKPILRTGAQIAEDYGHLGSGLGLVPDVRYLALLPFYHAYGSFGLLVTLASGGTVMPVKRFVPAAVLDSARSFAPTLLLTTPQMVNALGRCHLKPGQEGVFASVQHALCGAASLAEEDHTRFRERFGLAIKIQYGSTETLSVSVIRDGSYASGRVGHPYPGVELAIFDEAGRRLPPLQTGRVGVRGPACCSGYGADGSEPLDQIDGFVLPGDMGFLDAHGELNLAGRDGIINIGGYKVSPPEIEGLIAGAFVTSYVKIMPHSRGGVPALRAVIESTDPAISARAVTDLCRQHLLDYKVPARIDVFPHLPRNDTGKVTLSQIAELLGDD